MAMEVAAAKATEEPREGRARQKERKAASQTVRMGERNLLSTLWKKFGWRKMSKLDGLVRLCCLFCCDFERGDWDQRKRGKKLKRYLQSHHLSRKQTSFSNSMS